MMRLLLSAHWSQLRAVVLVRWLLSAVPSFKGGVVSFPEVHIKTVVPQIAVWLAVTVAVDS